MPGQLSVEINTQDLKRPRDWFVIVENDYVLQL